MNALIVVNIGGKCLLPKSRESMQAAAARWGVDYVELTKPVARPLGRSLHPMWTKAILYRTAAAPYPRVLVLDADMLIRSDCPSPFDVVPVGHVGVVCRFQGEPLPDAWIDRTLERWARKLGGLQVPPWQRSLNGGFVLYEPGTHTAILQRWEAAGKAVQFKIWNLFDQASLSVVLHNSDVPQTWLPREWNTVHAVRAHTQDRAPAGVMRTWVYHFVSRRRRAARIAACEWHLEHANECAAGLGQSHQPGPPS